MAPATDKPNDPLDCAQAWVSRVAMPKKATLVLRAMPHSPRRSVAVFATVPPTAVAGRSKVPPTCSRASTSIESSPRRVILPFTCRNTLPAAMETAVTGWMYEVLRVLM